MDAMKSAQSKRWHRFSLRFLLGLVAICAVGCWGYWGAWPWWKAYQEQQQFIEDAKQLNLQSIDASLESNTIPVLSQGFSHGAGFGPDADRRDASGWCLYR